MSEFTETSPAGRVTGFVYLAYFILAVPAGTMLKQSVSAQHAGAAAQTLLARESLFQLGISLDIAANAFYLALSVLLYSILAPVGRRAALLALILGASGCGVQLVGDLLQSINLVIQTDDQLTRILDTHQIRAAALLASHAYTQTFYISLALFGLFDVLMGWLMVRSRFLPRLIGVLWIGAGLGWLTFLWPPLATRLSVYILAPGMFAELVLMLWLLMRGVDRNKWRQVAQATP